MVCPELFKVCSVLLALLRTVCPISTIDCSPVFAIPMLVLMLLMVSVNAEIFASCPRAAMANPSFAPIPAYEVDFFPVVSCDWSVVNALLRLSND